MGFDLFGIFRDPPPYLFGLLALAGLAVGAMLWRLARRHRHGADRVTVRLSDWEEVEPLHDPGARRAGFK